MIWIYLSKKLFFFKFSVLVNTAYPSQVQVRVNSSPNDT